LKIALIRQRYNPYGGAERFVSRALSALAQQQSVSLHLIAREWESIEDIEFHSCNPAYFDRLSRDLGFAIAACRTAAKLDVDLIQSHERLGCCDIYRAGDGVHKEWLKQRSRSVSRFQRWFLNIDPYHLYLQMAERHMFQNPRLRAVICNSNMIKGEILEYFAIAEDKIHVIHNGIDISVFHPDLKQQRLSLRQQWGLAPEQTVFVFVGSGYERKGLAQLLNALTRLKQAHLLVVGYDKQEQHYRKLAQRLGLDERVTFAAAQQDVKPFYAMSDALVLPTLYDPFPNVVLEAMACGLPVITSNKSGAAEILKEGESGFVRDSLDIDGIAEAMIALSSHHRAQTMGHVARQTAEDHDWSIIGETLTRLYLNLAQQDQN